MVQLIPSSIRFALSVPQDPPLILKLLEPSRPPWPSLQPLSRVESGKEARCQLGANAFPISCWNSVRKRASKTENSPGEESDQDFRGVVGEKKIEEKEKGGSDLNNALRVYPSSDCSCLWTFDNSGNQLSRISYPLCVCSNPRGCRLLSDDRSAMAFNEISCVLYLHFFLLFAYILYKCISTFCLASV